MPILLSSHLRRRFCSSACRQAPHSAMLPVTSKPAGFLPTWSSTATKPGGSAYSRKPLTTRSTMRLDSGRPPPFTPNKNNILCSLLLPPPPPPTQPRLHPFHSPPSL